METVLFSSANKNARIKSYELCHLRRPYRSLHVNDPHILPDIRDALSFVALSKSEMYLIGYIAQISYADLRKENGRYTGGGAGRSMSFSGRIR